jgi:nitroreductase
MDFGEVVKKRRSIRKFTDKKIPEEIMREALHHATLAPNSSNMQMWDFYWVRNPENKNKLIEACLNQSTARMAQELVVITINTNNWKRSLPYMRKYVDEVNAPKPVKIYYHKLIPLTYRSGFFNILAPVKYLTATIAGFFRPVPRGPYTSRDLQEVCIKSAALACENFVLSLTNHGYQTCMMEGFDEKRVKKLLKLKCGSRVVMVISAGEELPGKGTWGEQFRMPLHEVIHEI